MPIREQNNLWDCKEPPEGMRGVRVEICTDGSTFPDRQYSGSGVVYLTDQTRDASPAAQGHYFTITQKDNYAAEMAAINRAIRSVPASVPITIYTDSLASIKAIKRAKADPVRQAPLKRKGRTYVQAILTAIAERDRRGAQTQILHVRSHTGARDDASKGNEAADKMARTAALGEFDPDADIRHDAYDLEYVPMGGKEQMRGSARIQIKQHLLEARWREWRARPKHGELARCDRKGIEEYIQRLWKNPSSEKLVLAIHALT